MKYAILDASNRVSNVITGTRDFVQKAYPGQWVELADGVFLDIGMTQAANGTFFFDAAELARQRAQDKATAAADSASLADQIAALQAAKAIADAEAAALMAPAP